VPNEDLVVEELGVMFGDTSVVRDVSLRVDRGRAYGLVGESGSGKTMTVRAILGLAPATARVSGRVTFHGTSLLDLAPSEMQRLRGSQIGMIFQDPSASLNPLLRVGDAVAQVMRSHERVGRRAARERATEMLARVGIRNARRQARSYPHQLSGGMRQRVMIAMALAGRPSLLLADEPTTALDVIVQSGILRLVDELRRAESMSLLLVSHDFSVVAGMCDLVGVMYAGQLVEEGPASRVLLRPSHPYTRALIDSLPEATSSGPLPTIRGAPPEPKDVPVGCAFAPRCPLATEQCSLSAIPLITVEAHHVSRCIHFEQLEARGQAPPGSERWTSGV